MDPQKPNAKFLPPRRDMLRLAAIGAGYTLLGGSILTACGGGGESAAGRAMALTTGCTPTTWTLTAGQTIPIGTVTVSNDSTNIYVTYSIDTASHPDCVFGTLHLWIGDDLANVPANPQGTPVPGHFPFVFDAGGLTTYTFTIPFTQVSLSTGQQLCSPQPLSLYVVTHAEIECTGAIGSQTAFGGPNPGPGPRWWFYGAYTVCCDLTGPPPAVTCQTAFAKGGHVFTTDPKSNPEGLPSLRLTRNRWGWAINLTAPGETTYDIWSGAGLNKTANGTNVGTLTVNWDGSNATVTYQLDGTCTLQEVHLYAGDARPGTTAPGQYGNLAYFDPPTDSHTFHVALADSNGVDGVWLIAHAVVCCSCC